MVDTISQEATEVIIEQDDDEAALDIPPDRRRVKTEKSDLMRIAFDLNGSAHFAPKGARIC